jgi:hypothetical protein
VVLLKIQVLLVVILRDKQLPMLFFLYSLTLKAIGSFETSTTTIKSTRCNIPEDLDLLLIALWADKATTPDSAVPQFITDPQLIQVQGCSILSNFVNKKTQEDKLIVFSIFFKP